MSKAATRRRAKSRRIGVPHRARRAAHERHLAEQAAQRKRDKPILDAQAAFALLNMLEIDRQLLERDIRCGMFPK